VSSVNAAATRKRNASIAQAVSALGAGEGTAAAAGLGGAAGAGTGFVLRLGALSTPCVGRAEASETAAVEAIRMRDCRLRRQRLMMTR
jgi:hypothetical protein